MMFWQDMDKRARRLGILDTKLAQGAAIFFSLTVVKVIPEILAPSTWWFAGLAVVCAIRPVMTFIGQTGVAAESSDQR